MKLSFLLRAGTHACALAHSPLFVFVPDCFRFIHLEGIVKYLGTRLLLTSLLAVARYEARFPEGPTTLPKDYVRLCFTPFGFQERPQRMRVQAVHVHLGKEWERHPIFLGEG